MRMEETREESARENGQNDKEKKGVRVDRIRG